MKTISCLSAVFVFALPIMSAAQADDAAPASISVAPMDIHLSALRDRQGLIVQAVMPNGLTADVTDQATWTVENESFVRRDGANFYPVADGDTKITVTYGGHAVDVPVVVRNSQVDPPSASVRT
jgi:hypothetical protein